MNHDISRYAGKCVSMEVCDVTKVVHNVATYKVWSRDSKAGRVVVRRAVSMERRAAHACCARCRVVLLA